MNDAKYDKRLNKNKFPTLLCGYYTDEPQFGNLVREALRIGFELFSYEDTVAGRGGTDREIEQAKNIKLFMDKHPNGKFLIHCGYGHLVEADSVKNHGKMMGGWLKKITGIDLFTVNQVHFTERHTPKFENPFFKMMDESIPSVFVDKEGHIFNGIKGQNYVDVKMYHPRTKYINGRTDWLIIEDRQWVKFSAKDIKIDFPCLALAYYSEEPDFAVPCDIMVLNDKKEQKAFALKKGNYRVKVFNDKQESQTVMINVK
jgi:hypothetical protein